MNSVYIHIPFCNYKCDYCNFFVLQKNHPNFQVNLITEYIQALHREIDHRNSTLWVQKIRTIYIGGGTPLLVGKEALFGIIDHIKGIWWLEEMEELSIELNPDPFEETLDFVRECHKRYEQLPRIRYSFGIQTFDDEVLKISWRQYSFNQIKWYLRELQTIKQPTMCYNIDFIAFGTLDEKSALNQGWLWWSKRKKEFFDSMIVSHAFDSISLYMLELFPWSKRHNQKESSPLPWVDTHSSLLHTCINPDDDAIMEEYTLLSDSIQSAWYRRYEVSNYALPGKQSIHNTVYRTMQPYLWVWASASGLLIDRQTDGQPTYTRYTNSTSIHEYIKWSYQDPTKTHVLTEKIVLFESCMTRLRSSGILDCHLYKDIFVPNREEKLHWYDQQWLCLFDGKKCTLTNEWYNVANMIISELIA